MRPINPEEVRLAWQFITDHLVKEIEASEPDGRAAIDTMEHAVGVLLGMFPEESGGAGIIEKMSTVLEAQRSNGWPRPGRFTHDDAIGPDCFSGSDFD